MERRLYNQFRELVYEKAGIHLGEKKEALINARVAKRLRELRMDDYRSYLQYVVNDPSGEELVHLLDVISTNVTSFFREANHFDTLRELMCKWLGEGQRRFRYWSAACSTGEEPYTMAMVALEAAAHSHADIRILATDISTRVLEKARAGLYPPEKTAGIPPALLGKYFERTEVEGRPHYRAGRALRGMIVFKRLNLSAPPFPMRGPLDCVFCRNVMIYFDNHVRRGLLREVERLLRPDGYLFVGHAESLTGQLCKLRNVKPAVYRACA
jgi:chemotaxis protein methyltransferase CheR